MAKTGLSYYQAETDRFQDIKIKRLKKRYGCEGYAIYQYIQNEIYRVEGCFIRFTDDQMFDVSEYWSIEEERVEAIIEYCVEVEIFDAITMIGMLAVISFLLIVDFINPTIGVFHP